MTRAVQIARLRAFESAAQDAAEAAVKAQLELGAELRDADACAASVHLAAIRTARESAARLRALLEEAPR